MKALTIALLALASTSFAQTPTMPPEIERLMVAEGTWRGPITFTDAVPLGPITTSLTIKAEPALDGQYMRVSTLYQLPNLGKVEGFTMLRALAEDAEFDFQTWTFTNSGRAPYEGTGTLTEDGLDLFNVVDGIESRTRYVWTDDGLRLVFDNLLDGEWTVVASAELQRVADDNG